jgi:sigma-B regulation protein RsbU (phosphoserine phosphatase)
VRKPIRILIVEDSEFDTRVLVNNLKQGGYEPTYRRVDDPSSMREALTTEAWDAVLSDYNLPAFSAPAALALLQSTRLDLPFIIISGGIGEDIAVAAMKAGAHDYLMKGNLARLAPAVERELREAETRRARRLAEEALRDSEHRYRLLWENSTDAVLLMSADSTIHFANPAVEVVFGYRPEEVSGRPFLGLLAEAVRTDFPRWAETCLGAKATDRRPQPIESLGCHKTSGERIIEIGLNALELKGAQFLVAFIRDITERKRAEEESRLLQGISLAVHAAKDLDSALEVVLRAVCETTGWALGQAWLPSHDGLHLECSAAHCARAAGLEPFRIASEQLQFRAGVGVSGRAWAARQPVWIRDITDLVNSPRAAVARQVGILAALGIPVLADDEVIAVIEFFLLERREEDERFIRLTSAIAAQLGGVVQRKQAEQELQDTEEQLRVARDIQQRLFPKAPPHIPGFDIAGASNPASATGGDYFDYLPMRQGRLGVVVGDVTGHGIGPALLMAETRAYLRVLAESHDDAADVLSNANRVLAEDIGSERFITMLLVSLDPQRRVLSYANAGHTAGYVFNAAGEVRAELRRTGVPLGVRADTRYPPAQQVPLAAGDFVLLLTDGIDEAMSPDDRIFGIERALEVVRAQRGQPAQNMVEALYEAVRRFAENSPQLDDATAVVIKVL